MEREKIRKKMSRILKSEWNVMERDSEYVDDLVEGVLSRFEGDRRVDDDDVPKEMRDIFYLLESMGLLKLSFWEKPIRDGRVWKNHYWVLRTDRMSQMEDGEIIRGSAGRGKSSREGIYERLSDRIWSNHLDRMERTDPPKPMKRRKRNT